MENEKAAHDRNWSANKSYREKKGRNRNLLTVKIGEKFSYFVKMYDGDGGPRSILGYDLHLTSV
jgi:hypothetical protein